jgi:hypothetical protein
MISDVVEAVDEVIGHDTGDVSSYAVAARATDASGLPPTLVDDLL